MMVFCLLLVMANFLAFGSCQQPASIYGNETLFVKDDRQTVGHWNDSVYSLPAADSASSRIECASLCLQGWFFNDSQCNAFVFDKPTTTCSLANLAFLEDHQQGLTYQEFHVNFQALSTIRRECYGQTDCCTPDNQCQLNRGDCNTEEDCQGHGAICGTKNCLTITGNAGGEWDSADDCCERRCTPEHPCPLGDGDCKADNDCQDTTFLFCATTNGICYNDTIFPTDQFPNNTNDTYTSYDDCCTRLCYPFDPCPDGQTGCLVHADCLPGLDCNPSGTNGICSDVNECNWSPPVCGSDATCTNTIGSYTCACNSGYEDHVDNVGCSDINECSTNPPICGSDATCANFPGTYNCTCNTGYENFVAGSGCSDINECTDTPGLCGANADCDNDPGDYNCHCHNGFENHVAGVGCSDVDECTSGYNWQANKCGFDGDPICVNTLGSYDCECPDGYYFDLNDGCYDINECSSGYNGVAYCGSYADCVNTAGNFTCTCDSGYENHVPNTGCSDIDECATNHGDCGDVVSTICTNYNGYRQCSCSSGFTGLNTGVGCSDIDECADGTAICGASTLCVNTPGSYTCTSCSGASFCPTITNSYCYQTTQNADLTWNYVCRCNNGYVRNIHGSNTCGSNPCGSYSLCDYSWVTSRRLTYRYSLYSKSYSTTSTNLALYASSCESYCRGTSLTYRRQMTHIEMRRTSTYHYCYCSRLTNPSSSNPYSPLQTTYSTSYRYTIVYNEDLEWTETG